MRITLAPAPESGSLNWFIMLIGGESNSSKPMNFPQTNARDDSPDRQTDLSLLEIWINSLVTKLQLGNAMANAIVWVSFAAIQVKKPLPVQVTMRSDYELTLRTSPLMLN